MNQREGRREDLGGMVLGQALLSAKLFTHYLSDGENSLSEEPESCVKEALHLGGGRAGTQE